MKTKKLPEEIQKTMKRRWKFIEGKERPIVYLGLFIAFIILIVLILTIYEGMEEKFLLQMKIIQLKTTYIPKNVVQLVISLYVPLFSLAGCY